MIKTYKDFKEYKFLNDGQIPKIVFRTGRYNVNELPSEIKHLYEKEIIENPYFSFFYFDDKDCEEFILLEYGSEMFKLYDTLIPTAFKADFWRYLILYKHGGTYIDFSMHVLVPYDQIVKHYRRQIYVRDACDICGIYNAFISTVSNTEILDLAIKKIIYNINKKYKGVSCLDITGPTMLGRIFKDKLNLLFYDWIPVGGIKNDLYLYCNPRNELIQDEFENVIIKNRLDNHYQLAYDEKPHPLLININNEIKPFNHYSRLWNDDKIYKD
jgi:mannosyltransferase OCH1-like enzyme